MPSEAKTYMDVSYYANLAEIIGTTAIVVSLVYVAVQIRQNNRHLAQEAQRARAQSVRENWGAFADNAEVWVKDLNGETLTAAEAFRMNALWFRTLFSYQTSFQQLSRNEILAHANLFRRMFETMQSMRTAWEQYRDTFQPDFIRFMEENVIDER